MPTNVSSTELKKFTWHNVTDNGEAEIRYLRDHFEFSSAHLKDCADPPLRPKIEFADT